MPWPDLNAARPPDALLIPPRSEAHRSFPRGLELDSAPSAPAPFSWLSAEMMAESRARARSGPNPRTKGRIRFVAREADVAITIDHFRYYAG